MREILFRGKPKNKADLILVSQMKPENVLEDFVLGLLIIKDDRYFICVSTMGVSNGSLINNCISSVVEVIPETVGEFTSVPDKNGKKIFEGDIVQYTYLDEYILRAVVKFGEYEQDGCGGEYPPKKCIGFYVEVINDDCLADCFDYKKTENILQVASECEIIGNIHDNPELLNKKENDE